MGDAFAMRGNKRVTRKRTVQVGGVLKADTSDERALARTGDMSVPTERPGNQVNETGEDECCWIRAEKAF